MTKEEMNEMFKIYIQRYGSFTMKDETKDMWWSKLYSLDFKKVEEVFHDLIGNEEKPFGWKKVLTHVNLRYPAEDEQAVKEKEWKADPKNKGVGDKQKAFNAFLRPLMTEITRKRGQNFDWISKFVKEYIENFGRNEAELQISKLSLMYGKTDAENKFINAIRKELR